MRSRQRAARTGWALCALPTGSGKTLVGIVAASRIAGRHDVLWLAHQRELLERAKTEVERAKAQSLVPHRQRFQFFTIQEFLGWSVEPTDALIVFDEAHHLHSGKKWISNLRRRARPVLGLTATPRRSHAHDGWHLATYVTRDELTPRYLAPPVPIVCHTGFRPAHVGLKVLGTVEQRDFDSETYRALDVQQRNALVAEFLVKRPELAPMLVYVSRREHAESLAKALGRRGLRAAFVHGDLRTTDRDNVFRDFGEGRCDALVNVNLVSEGVDLPELRSVVMAVPTVSDIRFTQMIGRGCRKTDRKRFFYLVDFVDNLGQFEPLLQGKYLFDGVRDTRGEYDPNVRTIDAEYRFTRPDERPDQPYLRQLLKQLTRGFVLPADAPALQPEHIEDHLLRVAKRNHMPLSADERRPREVPFVHEFVYPLVQAKYPEAGVRKEVFIEEGLRCDILVLGKPIRVIEFAATRVNTAKVDQLLDYRRALRRVYRRDVDSTLVAVSLNGSSRSRRFEREGVGVNFINWHDFVRDLQ